MLMKKRFYSIFSMWDLHLLDGENCMTEGNKQAYMQIEQSHVNFFSYSSTKEENTVWGFPWKIHTTDKFNEIS